MSPTHHDRHWGEHPHVPTGKELSFGDRAADAATATLGGWRFFWGMTGVIAFWIIFAGCVFGWDPYPFQFLTLMLSLQASYAAPLILMSQNRESAVNAVLAQHDRERAERIEAKLDQLIPKETP